MNKFTTPLLHAAIAAALMLGAASTSYAVPATGTLSVTANVVAACNVSTSDALNFGSSINNLSGAAVDGAGALHIQCTTGSTPSVALDQGQNDASGTATAPARRMKANTSDYLAYELYSDENRTTVWGADAASLSITPDGSNQTIDVYGRITAGQNAAAVGSYSDSVAVTVTF
jgi:spore coat protein U-like protein